MRQTEMRGLGEEGRANVRDHLAQTNIFCAALLETLNSVPGEVFTVTPRNTPAERLSEFSHGGLLPENLSEVGAIALPDGSRLVPVISLIDEQAKLLMEAMKDIRGAVCIVDDFNPSWGDQAPDPSSELCYESRVLDAPVGFLNRQWSAHLSQSGWARSRSLP